MAETEIKTHKIRPEFDLEEFMNFSRETRLASDALRQLLVFWEEWSDLLEVAEIRNGSNSWLAIWLPEEIEQKVDEIWSKSPGEGFLINSLAQYMCMSAANTIMPETAGMGCAPSPRPDLALDSALDSFGLGQMGPALARRYAILTYYPFKGGCEICGLQEECPRNIGEPSFATVTLPGHERGRED